MHRLQSEVDELRGRALDWREQLGSLELVDEEPPPPAEEAMTEELAQMHRLVAPLQQGGDALPPRATADASIQAEAEAEALVCEPCVDAADAAVQATAASTAAGCQAGAAASAATDAAMQAGADRRQRARLRSRRPRWACRRRQLR